MRINTKIRYGLRTMIELACLNDPKGMLQKDIAEKQELSIKYLDAIIAALKAKGLVKNVRGKGSGYKLSRPACEISMFDIYTAFENICVVECLDNPEVCALYDTCASTKFWGELRSDFTEYLKSKTLKDVAKKETPCMNSQNFQEAN